MIQVYSYDRASDKIKKLDITDNGRHISWTRIVSPDEELIKTLSENSGIPLQELQEGLEEEERPKVTARNYLEIIYRAPYVVKDELETTPIYLYVFPNRIITVEKKALKILDDMAENMSRNKDRFLFRRGISYFIYYILDKINDDFLSRIERIASRLDVYENFSKKDLNDKDIERIYDHSVTLSFFNQALIANVEVLNTLRKSYFKQIRDRSLFEELYFNVLQILDTEKIQRESITHLVNMHSIITSNRLNGFMRRLTTLALIVAIPTLITGIYGMNFQHIPLTDSPYGFYIFIVLMIMATGGAYLMFRSLKWL